MRLWPKRRRRIFIARLLDMLIKKRPPQVTVVVNRRAGYSNNLRAVTDQLVLMDQYEIAVFCECKLHGDVRTELLEKNVKVLEGFSLEHLLHILSSGVLLFSHSARDGFVTRRSKGRRVINLWHGVALKRIEFGMSGLDPTKARAIKQNARVYDAMIASSYIDRLHVSSSFCVPLERVFVCGLPRYDLLDPAYPWSRTMIAQLQALKRLKGTRRLVVLATTFRENTKPLLSNIQATDWKRLQHFLKHKGFVLGIRPHPYEAIPDGIVDEDVIVDISSEKYPETNMVLGQTDALIVDYTSTWVDFLLTGRPIIGFSVDMDSYILNERGFAYELESVFPGTFCGTMEELLVELDSLCFDTQTTNERYRMSHAVFHTVMSDTTYTVKFMDTVWNKITQ